MKLCSVRLFSFFQIYNFWVNCHFFRTPSPPTSYINTHHRHTRLWWKGCWLQTIWELLANMWYLWGPDCDEAQDHGASSTLGSLRLPDTSWHRGLCTLVTLRIPHISSSYQNTDYVAFVILKAASRVKPFNTGTLKTGGCGSQLLKNWEFSPLRLIALPWFYIIHGLSIYRYTFLWKLQKQVIIKCKILPTFTIVDPFHTLESVPLCWQVDHRDRALANFSHFSGTLWTRLHQIP